MDSAKGNDESPGIIRAAELHEIVVALSGAEPAGVIISGAGGSGMTTLLDAAASVLEGTFSVVARSAASSFNQVPFSIAMALIPDLPATSNAWPHFLVQASRKALRSAGPPGMPVLLALDNIEFLDDQSLWLLNQILAEPDIRLLATHRSDRPLRMELMESVVARQFSVVNLSELGEEEMHDFLASCLQGKPGVGLVREVRAASGGNMLAARLLLEESRFNGGLAYRGGEWLLTQAMRKDGSQVPELLRRRMERYPRQQRQLIELLAVGEPVAVGIAEEMAGHEALADLRASGVVRIQSGGLSSARAASATLSHVLEADAARQLLAPDETREMRLTLHRMMPRGSAVSLWDLFRRVSLEQETGLPTPQADLLAVAIAANDLHDSQRAAHAASAVAALELKLPAGVELARALYLTGDVAGSAQLLRRLVASPDSASNAEFLRAVWLLLRALYPSAPAPSVLQGILNDARRRVEAAFKAGSPGGQEARDQLDVMQAYLDTQAGNWPRPGSMLFERLNHGQTPNSAPGLTGDFRRQSASSGAPGSSPSSEAGVLLMALVSQGLAVGGRFAEAVELSTAALESLDLLPRCTVEFHATVLIIHGSNLAWRGQWGGREMACWGASRQAGGRLAYFAGPGHLYRALVLARQGNLELACEHFRQAKARFDVADPEGLLPPTLGGLAAAAWMLGDVPQVRRALAAYDARPMSGTYLAARLAESYCTAARSVVSGAAASSRRLLRMADAAGKRGHRALEILDLGLAARTGAGGLRIQEAAAGDLAWKSSPGIWAEGPYTRTRPPSDADGEAQEGKVQVGFPPSLAAQVPESAANIPGSFPAGVKLSHRERQVADLIASGLSSADVSERLGISVNTVNAHLQRAYGKLGVSSRRELSEVWNHARETDE